MEHPHLCDEYRKVIIKIQCEVGASNYRYQVFRVLARNYILLLPFFS